MSKNRSSSQYGANEVCVYPRWRLRVKSTTHSKTLALKSMVVSHACLQNGPRGWYPTNLTNLPLTHTHLWRPLTHTYMHLCLRIARRRERTHKHDRAATLVEKHRQTANRTSRITGTLHEHIHTVIHITGLEKRGVEAKTELRENHGRHRHFHKIGRAHV